MKLEMSAFDKSFDQHKFIPDAIGAWWAIIKYILWAHAQMIVPLSNMIGYCPLCTTEKHEKPIDVAGYMVSWANKLN